MLNRIFLASLVLAVSLGVAFGAAGVSADEQSQQPKLSPEDETFFEQKIRPLLVERCFKCHGAEKPKGGLRLTSRKAWEQGGDTGPAVVPGQPEMSLLIKAVRYADADLQMPPAGKLPEAEIQLLEEWVRRGAPDPRGDEPAAAKRLESRTGTDHWAFQPLQKISPPEVREAGWALDEIDKFVLAVLEQGGLPHSPEADRQTWLRRVTLDLTGLPPTPAEIEVFVNDSTESAWSSVVDRLLASRAFGERFARPWLDLVGYADQIGSANNVPADHAWRFRDYVIHSVEQDLPVDQFIRQQVAGDLLTAGSIEERRDQLVATGFLVLGNVNIVEADKLVMRMDIVDQQVEKIGKVFLGMTLNCVRCHDHKFDPITLRDYYGLAGIFASTEATYKEERGVWSSVTKVPLPETLEQFTLREAARKKHDREVALVQNESVAATARLAEIEPKIKAAKEAAAASSPLKKGTVPPGRANMSREISAPERDSPLFQQTARPAGETTSAGESGADPGLAELEKEAGQLNGKLKSLETKLWHLNYIQPGTPLAYAVKDSQEIADAKIQVRGNPHVLGEAQPRGFVNVVTHGPVAPIPQETSGRAQLAEWLTGPASALVSRVAVNRLWQALFGRGIVGSVDYFGVRGDVPTHPELLEYVAGEFVRDGWSRKQLIRRLVLSRTYRQQSAISEATQRCLASDPDNRLLWRMSPRRLEAEMIRDSALAVSGALIASNGGPALSPEFMENVGGLNPKDVNPISFSLTKFREEQHRVRTIYLPVVRSSEQRGPGDVLNFFDFAQPARFTGERPTTAVAAQSLFLLNGPLLTEAARKLAETILVDMTLATDDERLTAVYLRVLGRNPGAEDLQAAQTFLASEPKIADKPALGWQRLIHALLASNEFLFRL